MAIRKIFSLPYQSHRWLLGPLIGQYHISNQLIRRDIKCLHRMINCPNAIIRQCILNTYYNANSLIGILAYFRSSFGIDIFNCDIMRSQNRMFYWMNNRLKLIVCILYVKLNPVI